MTGSSERSSARREEILNACEKLYATMNFREITLREIGEATTFTRPSIYNYFHTKEEIFLGLLKREHDLWVAALEDAAGSREQMTDEEIAACIAGTLAQRQLLLKLLSTNHFDLEESCSVEALVDFKISYAKTLDAVAALLAKFRPDMDETAVQEFQFTFFPFLFGVYPYTTLTDRQKETMERAGVRFAYYSVYDMIHRAVTKMLPARS